MESSNQTKPSEFPDISPLDFENHLSQFSMTAGDFLQIYNENSKNYHFFAWNFNLFLFIYSTNIKISGIA